MIVGVPAEIKNHEYRVGLVPASVQALTERGHTVLVESQAGLGVGLNDYDYQRAGGELVGSAQEVFARANMVVKVKEPQAQERKWLREDQILFTYLHLAPDLEQTCGLINSGAVCIAYETVTNADGRLPLLAPMSEVAGRMSVQAGAHCLEKSMGGSGVLLGGVSGVEPARVVVLGGGVVGSNAVQMVVGMHADVTLLDNHLGTLQRLDSLFNGRLKTLYSNTYNVAKQVADADLVIGGVLIPGGAAPKLVTSDMIANMKAGAVVVDVAIDQGGCFETSRPTTHDEPTFVVDDVVHYCVANMPGAVARTSTFALNNATLPYVMTLADKGYREALYDDAHFRAGLNVIHGKLTHASVCESQGKEYVDPLYALTAHR